MGLLRGQGIPNEQILIDAWGPPVARIAHKLNTRPAPLMERAPKTGWKILDGELALLKPGLTGQQLVSEFNA